MKTAETACAKARPHYYDFICGRKTDETPDDLWRHMASCAHCKIEIKRLAAALEPQDDSPRDDAFTATTANLELQFNLVGQSVDCSTIKPFLATLADPLLAVSCPTPITAHVNECHACADDLQAIRQLYLSHSQLCRLGQMLAESGRQDAALCPAVRQAVPSVAALDLGGVETSILQHMCVCPDCRQSLFHRRQALANDLPVRKYGCDLPCREVACSDLFDICLPYGDLSGTPAGMLSHVTACRPCMDKLQALLHTVSHVMDRPASGIQTRLAMADLARLHTGAPSAPPSKSAPPAQAAPARQSPPFRRLLKPFAAAAAVLLAVLLVMHGTRLTATDLSLVYAKLADVNTLHLRIISPENSEVVQEIWMSQKPAIKLFRQDGQYVLWDLQAKLRTSLDSPAGEALSIPIDNNSIREVAATLIGPLHILPFSKISEVPRGAKWYRVTDQHLDASLAGAETYEMVWQDKTPDGAPVFRKWRGMVDPETKLPLKTEFFVGMDTDQNYELQQICELAYPPAEAIQRIIREIGL